MSYDPRNSVLPNRITQSALATILLVGATHATAPRLAAQSAPSTRTEDPEETVQLNPFVVDSSRDRGYQATSTLAGTRIRTDLADVGSAISVITSEMLTDLGATNNETVLAYGVNTEVGGPRGNFSGGVKSSTYQEQDLFANPNGNTRVRGLTSADNTRNYFLSDVPWDGYTVSRVDLQRGPNAILFGLGSPAGVVNATTNAALFENKGKFEVSFDNFSSQRYVFDYNHEVLPDQLAMRVAYLRYDQKFQQDPAYAKDVRLYGAIKYKPTILNRPGTRFEISGNFEHGNIRSNRPRTVTPGDLFSGFWDPESKGGTNKKTYDPFKNDIGNEDSPDYTEVVGGSGEGSILGLVNSKGTEDWAIERVYSWGALRPDGSVIPTLNDNEFGAFPRANAYGRVGVINFNQWAGEQQLPFASFGAYNSKTISDPSIFDFYNKLIDGVNKSEWSDWDVFDVNLTHTFLDDSLGYDVSHFRQKLHRGNWSILGWGNTIYMDINAANGLNVPNPDVGRAYVQVENRDFNSAVRSERDATRIQGFGQYDFQKRHEGWWARALGLHRLTAVWSEENHQQDSRMFRYADLDYDSKKLFMPSPRLEGSEILNPGFRYYLSDDLRSQSTAAGSNLGNMSMLAFQPQGGPVGIRAWDNTWIAPSSVNPADPWINPYRPDTPHTQSNNPANYRGWVERQANLVTIHSPQRILDMNAQDYLTSTGTLSDFAVDSKILVWQGHFWNRSIIGTYGYREDKARSYLYNSSDRNRTGRTDTGGADLRPTTYNFNNPKGSVTELETETRNWSVAVHLNRLLGQRDFLPVNISLYYNEGENFQPLSGRIDAFARPLAAPSGTTEERSVLIATKDNRYTLRATQFETDVKNGNSTGSIGAMWALEQVLGFTGTMARDFRAGRLSTTNYANSGGDVNRLVNQIFPAWFAFEKELKQQFPDFVSAWMGPGTSFGTDGNETIQTGAPAGFSFTEDSHSEGYEFEFTANPTDSWRIALNASKTVASRENVPGLAFKEVAAFIENAMQNTDAGLAPVWWDANTLGGRNVGPWTFFRPDYLRNNALNGQSAGEVRKWRVNMLTNYEFRTGKIKGFGVGGGYRWEDKAIIGYAPMKTAAGDDAINLNAPVYAPEDDTFDLWFSYSRKLSDRINWRIQLNIYNVFGKDELVPFAASVDYEALAGVGTITPTTVIPMRASAFTIRQGRSWYISNTFEF